MTPHFKAKSRIRKNFKNCNPKEEYYVTIYEIDTYFYDEYKRKIQIDVNKRKYILFKIDVYFSDYSLAVDIDGKGEDKDLIFELKRQKALEEKLNFKFIKINTGNDLDYEISYLQKFIDDFKDKKIKKLEDKLEERDKIKELEDEIKELKHKNRMLKLENL